MRPDLDWSAFQVAAAVARSGAVTQACKAVGVSAPTARRRIETLEQACGYDLFDRTERGLVPTAVGARLLAIAIGMEEAVRRAAEHRDRRAGQVTIATRDISALFLAPVVRRLNAEHPEIRLAVVTAAERAGALSVEADIVLDSLSPPKGAARRLSVGAAGLGLYASSAYIRRAGLPTSVETLSRHAMIGAETDEVNREVMALLDLPATLSPTFRSDNALARVRAIEAGVGVGALFHFRAASAPDLIRVLPDKELRSEFWLSTPRDAAPAPHVDQALKWLHAALDDSFAHPEPP